jgi:anti-anti-sigma factor
MPRCPTIGVLSPLLGGFYFGGLLSGINSAAQHTAARVIALQTQGAHAIPPQLLLDTLASEAQPPPLTYLPQIAQSTLSPLSFTRVYGCMQAQVDGWIVVLDKVSAEYLHQQRRPTTPVVTISLVAEALACPAVLPDNVGGMAAAVAHLIQHGHTRIAFIGNMSQDDIQQRYAGYQAALAQAGIALDPALCFTAEDNMELSGRKAAQRMLDAGLPCTAVVAGTDLNAIGVMHVLQTAGYHIPTDVAIIGFDDLQEARATTPPLASVRPQFDALGRMAAELLLAQIAGQVVLPGPHYGTSVLISRESCGCPANTDRLLALLEAPAPASEWKTSLAEQLVHLACYPLQPTADMPPSQIWPGVEQIVRTVAALVDGDEAPTSTERMRAWGQAVVLTRELEVHQALLALLHRAGSQQIAAGGHDAATCTRLDMLLKQARLELGRARLNTEMERGSYFERVIQSNYEISLAMLHSQNRSARDLTWLGPSRISRACLGLWVDEAADQPTDLMVGGVYSTDEDLTPLLGKRYPIATFPPDALLPAPGRAGGHITMLLPIRSPQRDWGVLAMIGTIDTLLPSGLDPSSQWTALLGLVLDHEMLVTSLAQQQEILQTAYERERVLATMVRDLGCPIIPLMSKVLLIPLNGAIDTGRAEQLISAVLDSVSSTRATMVLIDLTGVPLVDSQVAQALIQVTHAVTLLGARVILVGVRPEVAQSIVSLGIDLSSIRTMPTLAAALTLLQRG